MFPAWLREFTLANPVTAQFVLADNVHDTHAMSGVDGLEFLSTAEMVQRALAAEGHDLLYRYDPLTGIVLDHARNGVESADFFPDTHLGRATIGSVAKVADLMLQAIASTELRVAILIEGAPELWSDELSVDAARLRLVSRRIAERPSVVPLSGTIIWVADAEDEAPEWLCRADSTRILRLPLPALGTRSNVAHALIEQLPGFDALAEQGRHAAIAGFAEATEGVSVRGMRNIATLAQAQHLPPARIDEAVRSHMLGVVDTPWSDPLLLERIRTAGPAIEGRVLGQSHAVRSALNILLRSALGLTGAHLGRRSNGPQGTLFFAGPTGVGKTELAKALARVLFGAEDAYHRFDMTEFAAEHSESRLIGAPPGYIGHTAGGELTNAVNVRPFSVLLFDEIEKAHPRILDKFLQILDDGRLTDGAGRTVRFSESLIVFTSNLGANEINRAEDPLSRRRNILNKINRHFTIELQRPELLSRIGDNIIVFDPLSPEIGEYLANRYLDNVAETVGLRHGLSLSYDPALRSQLTNAALQNLDLGGRGIASTIETALINPLSRLIADMPHVGALRVRGARRTPVGWELDV